MRMRRKMSIVATEVDEYEYEYEYVDVDVDVVIVNWQLSHQEWYYCSSECDHEATAITHWFLPDWMVVKNQLLAQYHR